MRNGLIVLTMLLATGCSSSSKAHTSPASSAPPIDYQTATCRDWQGLPIDQQLVAAKWYARVLKARDLSATFIGKFARDITTDCRPAPQLALREVVAALATLDTDDFP